MSINNKRPLEPRVAPKMNNRRLPMTLKTLQPYANYFVPAIPRTPTNRYASIILLRETKSYAIFTTEGGEQQDVEQVPAG
ncbi:MAG: hypothetical protein ACP5ME_12245, partial [Anaerolineae bacterium]